MDRSQKEEMVKVLEEIFDNSGSVVMAEYSGLTVAEMTELRAKLREKNASIRVVKNRLAKIAMKGRAFEAAGAMLTGPVAIAYADEIGAALPRSSASRDPDPGAVRHPVRLGFGGILAGDRRVLRIVARQ